MIVGIFGGIGAGKTLLQTYFGIMAVAQKIKLYANYNIKTNYTPIINIEDLKHIDNTLINVVLLDEAWITADARRSGTSGNILFSQFILQSRKRNISTLIYTTQKLKQIDTRIRGITQYFLHPTITDVDPNGIPIILSVNSYEQNINQDLVYLDTIDYYVYGIHKLYNTFEVIEKSESDAYIHLVEKYKDYIGSKKRLKSLLVLDDKLSKTEAETLVDYIIE